MADGRSSLETFIRIAHEAGLPKDSLTRFLDAGYVPQPKQIAFHAAARMCDQPDGPTQIGFGGARGPGKSHALFAQVAHDDCQRVDNLKVLYLRKVAKNAREQFEDLRRVVLRETPHEYKSQAGIIYFPNGSRILIGHFKNESDIDSYLGLEYDIIVIEEATTLTISKYKALRDSNRTSKQGFRPRVYCSTNPGGVGHAWFKERFIKPARANKETDTRFVFATVDDNKFIDADYTKKLEDNTGWKLKAYRYGDWDIAAGQFFTNFRYDIHVIKPFKIPGNWSTWGSLDYGFNHPTVAMSFAKSDGETYIVSEYGERKLLPASHAPAIKTAFSRAGTPIDGFQSFVAGPDAFAQRGSETGKTVADQYKDHGIFLRPANNDRVSGAGQLLSLLGDYDRKPIIKSRLFIFDTCPRLIQQIPELQHDPNRPEDVLKVDIDEDGIGGDDYYDTGRYGLMVDASPGVFL